MSTIQPLPIDPTSRRKRIMLLLSHADWRGVAGAVYRQIVTSRSVPTMPNENTVLSDEGAHVWIGLAP